jgi:23S rRNA pseudouridine2604 synthase
LYTQRKNHKNTGRNLTAAPKTKDAGQQRGDFSAVKPAKSAGSSQRGVAGSSQRVMAGSGQRGAVEPGQCGVAGSRQRGAAESGQRVMAESADDGTMRLNRYIAACGYCSRREADELIEQGDVTLNGKKAEAGDRVDLKSDTVKIGEKILRRIDRKTVVAYYKPVGVTCTDRDPHAERTLSESFKFPIRLTYAGRLDRDSEGLLLMTNDGDLIDSMMRSSNRHEKEYIVRVTKRMSDADIARLRSGVFLRELEVKTRPCEVQRLGDRTVKIVLTQGLNNQIRRMVKTVNNEVKKLKRVRVLTVSLGSMQPGQIRELRGEELESLYSAAGLHR